LALIATATIGGCFVSFDGYQLGEAAGDGGASGHTSMNRGGAAGMTVASGGDAGALSSAGRIELGGAASGGSDASGAANGGDSAGGAPSGGNSAAGSGGKNAAGAPNGGAGSAGAPNGGAGTAGSMVSGGSVGVMHCPDGIAQRVSQEVPLPAGGYYCIDQAEVRNRDYKLFLDQQSGTGGQIAACAFNTSFLPDTTGQCDQYDPTNKPNLPIACVDWCDAAAFCKWDHKHLCGNLAGASNAPADFADASKSAWYRACSHAGDLDYPYGNAYNADACVGVDNTAIHPLASPHTDCVGGYDALYDMSGNVAEWEDSCTTNNGATDQCLDRGGSYLDASKTVAGMPSLQCNSNVHGAPKMATNARSTRSAEIGFRCCSEPTTQAL
jgi:sulfatase modifying factor 1